MKSKFVILFSSLIIANILFSCLATDEYISSQKSSKSEEPDIFQEVEKEAKEEREGMSKKEGFILSMVILLLVITILVKIVFNGLESLKEKEMNATNDMELTTEKCLTGCENFAYQLRSNNPMNGIDVFVSVENQVNVVINQEKIKEEYNINLKEELMDGALLFNQKVQDIFVSTIGQDQTATYIFFLMEDGTV